MNDATEQAGPSSSIIQPVSGTGELNVVNGGKTSDSGRGTASTGNTLSRTREHLPKVNPHSIHILSHRQLGSGTFGRVYHAKFTESFGEAGSSSGSTINGIDVAVKIAEDDKKKDLLKECSMLYKYGNNHKNIIKWYGLYDVSNVLGFVMEFMDCGTLDSLLLHERELDYTIDHVFSWLLQSSDAVNYMHSLKLVHRDLKPLNLLLKDNYLTLKLCDFGTVVDVRKSMTNMVGSAAYMAPEVFSGKSYGPPCDVYSMGIIAWQMIHRKSPYPQTARITLLWNVYEGMRPQESNCHPILTEFMSQCWAPLPENRPPMSTVMEFAKIMMQAYPKGMEPLKNRSLLQPDAPNKVGLRIERLSSSTVRVGGHRRTRSDEVTLVNSTIPGVRTKEERTSTPIPGNQQCATVNSCMVRSTPDRRSTTGTPFSHESTPTRSTSELYSSDAEHLLAKIPPELRPPRQILNDDSSETSYNEHLAMCMEYTDLDAALRHATQKKHEAMKRVNDLVRLRTLMQKREHLLRYIEEANRRIQLHHQQQQINTQHS